MVAPACRLLPAVTRAGVPRPIIWIQQTPGVVTLSRCQGINTPGAGMRWNPSLVLLAYLSGQQQMFQTVDVEKSRGQQPRKPPAHRGHGQQPRVDVEGLGETDQHVGGALRHQLSGGHSSIKMGNIPIKEVSAAALS